MDRVLTKLNNSKGGTRNTEATLQTIGTVQLKWNNTLRAKAIMGTNQRGSQSSDGIMEWTKRGTKVSWRGQQNKELTQGSGLGADSHGARPEGDVTKAAQIGNLLRIDQERQ